MTNKWYVVQSYSGSEKSVMLSIQQRAEKSNQSSNINEIVVPLKKVVEIRKGKKVEVEKNLFPGYVLVNMNLNNTIWQIIKNIPKVSGFVSSDGSPKPLSQKEVDSIFNKLNDDNFTLTDSSDFEVGEVVKVIDGGPFDGFSGSIESVDLEKKELVVSVVIFGRSTPVVIAFDHVEKV
ncbi:MAG: transcription termination/antitermination factor NusG [Rickettsiales bacterium]|nr:transcription termination/antitermination factor NusG [Rickettsiales bacterium]